MTEILIIIIPFMILSALGLPIAFGLCAGALCGILFGGFPTALIGQRMIVLADSYIIMAIPFFIMAGEIMTAGGATEKIVDVSKLLVGRIRGGLAQVNVVGSIIFAGLSGSSAADTAAIGGIVVPAMLKEGYSKGFTVAVTCASGALGPILPPSVFMVIYGAITGLSIGKLFLAGVIPGLIIGFSQMGVCYYYAVKRGESGRPSTRKLSISDQLKIVKDSSLALLLPFIIVFGIVYGAFTPTEAGVVAVFYSLIIGVLFYRKLRLEDIQRTILLAVYRTSQVLFMSASAASVGWLLASAGLGEMLVSGLSFISANKIIMLLLMTVSLLIITCFIDSLAAMIILTHALQSVGNKLGIDPIHFAIIVLVSIIFGGITPPVAPLTYIASSIADADPTESIIATLPFIVIAFITIAIIIIFPETCLFLPNLFMK